jgi:hypothetical protein
MGVLLWSRYCFLTEGASQSSVPHQESDVQDRVKLISCSSL